MARWARHGRQTFGENRAEDRRDAKKFDHAIAIDDPSSESEVSMTIGVNACALVVPDIWAGWRDAYPTSSKSTEGADNAPFLCGGHRYRRVNLLLCY